MKNIVWTTLLALSVAGCSQWPTGPTQPTGPSVTNVGAPAEPAPGPQPGPDPAPPVPEPPSEPTPLPQPPKVWNAEVGHELWYGPRQLAGHFTVSWTHDTLQFGNHGADIMIQDDHSLFALLYTPYPQRGSIQINFDTPTHATWTWNSLEGQASGELVYQ